MDFMEAGELRSLLKRKGLREDLADRIYDEEIDGSQFRKLNAAFLRTLGLKGGDILMIMDIQDKLQEDLGTDKNVEPHESEPEVDESHEVNSALSPFFSANDFSQLSPYERGSLYSSLKRYERAKELGLQSADSIRPYFIQDKKGALKSTSEKSSTTGTRPKRMRQVKAPPPQTTTASGRKLTYLPANQESVNEVVGNENHSDESPSSAPPLKILRTSERLRKVLCTDNHIEGQQTSMQAKSTGVLPFEEAMKENEDWWDDIPPISSISAQGPPRERISGSPSQVLHPSQGDAAEKETYAQSQQDYVQHVSMMKPQLASFNCSDILDKRLHFKESEKKEKVLARLHSGELLPSDERKRVVRALTKWLFFNHVSDPLSVSSSMKEGLAKSFVMAFPQYCMADHSTPWVALFNPATNTGWIANASRTIQSEHRKRKSKKDRDNEEKSRNTSAEGNASTCENDDDIELDATGILNLSLLMPERREREEIRNGMRLSFKTRESERSKGESITYFLEKYPHFRSYGGELIREEFHRMNAGAKDMVTAFNALKAKFLELPARRPIKLKFENDILRALMLISHNLPHDVALRGEDADHTLADEDSLVVLLRANDDVEEYVVKKKLEADGPVQPYLIVVRSQISPQIVRVFLALDNLTCQLNSTNILRAIELLIQTYWIFHVRYPLGWRNTLHFVQVYLFKVFEKSRTREDKATPSEMELWLRLKG